MSAKDSNPSLGRRVIVAACDGDQGLVDKHVHGVASGRQSGHDVGGADGHTAVLGRPRGKKGKA
jgi:hypothetical protein